MLPSGPFEAGTYTTIVFTYTVGEAGLKESGRLRIGTPNMGWGEPLVLCPNPIEEVVKGPERRHNPWKPLNTTFQLETSTKAWIRMWSEERGFYRLKSFEDRVGWEWAKRAVYWRWWINSDVELDDFKPGDRIIITYGDMKEHPFGVRVQPFPEDEAHPFICLVDVEGDGELREMSGSPIPVKVVSGPTNAHACLRFCRESQYNIIAINHSFMKYLDWSVFDADIDRVIEIYSCWGSYESREDNPLNSKRRPLNQNTMYCFSLGYTPGVIAAGDSHVGYPGRSLMFSDPNWCQNWKAGLAAVYAPELTREAIWDALYDRYCYGTTGARIVLRFHLSNAHMGSILEYKPDDDKLCRRSIRVTVCGTDYIRRVDIMKDNGLFHRVCPKSDRTEFTVTDELDQTPTTRDWYYIRVFQADSNAAWSSPIWIGPAGVDIPSVSLGEWIRGVSWQYAMRPVSILVLRN